MTRIDGQGSLAALVAIQLERRQKSTGRPSSTTSRPSDASALSTIRAIAADQKSDERQARKSLVRAMLVEQLGDSFANDPSFEQLASGVFEMLEDSESGKAALTAGLRQLIEGK